ncbi:hypothetical protein [Bacillus idriensis]|uniref:hypothetical protein n=1 Tax=Metabacillus idriensis TaxID=324768 RepID=UPI00174B8AF7
MEAHWIQHLFDIYNPYPNRLNDLVRMILVALEDRYERRGQNQKIQILQGYILRLDYNGYAERGMDRTFLKAAFAILRKKPS